jgi:periplasmic protein TonB
VSKGKTSSVLLYVYGGSVLLHAAIAVGAVLLPKSTTQQAVAIELHEAKKKKEPPKPEAPPPPPPPPVEKEKPRPAPAPAQAKVESVAKTEAPPPVPLGSDGFADLGVALGNAEGPAVATPTAALEAARPAPAATASATHKVEQLTATHRDTCTEPIVRPKRTTPVAPKYTLEARQAEVEGVVRVEVTVDETGHVVNARVVSGLGYGLDEAALTAARASTFEPASRCGKPVIGTIVLPFRFQET